MLPTQGQRNGGVTLVSQPKHVRSRRGTKKSKIRGTAFLLAIGMLAVIGLGSLASSSPASAHTPSVSATCSALGVNLVNYQVKPGSPEIPGTLITPEIAAWDEPGNPGQPYIAPTPDTQATYGPTEYMWKSWNWTTLVYDYRWSVSSPGTWWLKVWPEQSRPGPELTPFIAGDPGQPFIEPTVVHHEAVDAVYGPVTPAVLADSTPNNVVVTIDGVVQDNVDFGGSFVESYTFASQFVAHTYSVVVTAWDDPNGSHGWTKTYEGTTTPCQGNLVTPVAPTHTPPTCFVVGTLVGIDTDLYIWIRTGSDSEALLQAVAITAGTNLTGQTSFGPYDLTQLTGDACSPPPTSVTPAPPEWIDECGPDNGYWDYTDTAEYAYTETVNPDGPVTLTVAPKAGVVFPEGTITSWTEEDSNIPCPDERDVITPVTPAVTSQVMVCDATNYTVVTTSGTATIPVTAGGRYLLDGKVVSGTINLAPGTHAFTFELVSNEYKLSDTVVNLTVVIKAAVAPACVKPPTQGPRVEADFVSDDANGFNPLAGLVLALGAGMLLAAGFGFKRPARQR